MHFFDYIYNFAIRKMKTQITLRVFKYAIRTNLPMASQTSILALGSKPINSYLTVCGVLTDLKIKTTSNKWIIRCKLKIRELIKSIIKAQVAASSWDESATTYLYTRHISRFIYRLVCPLSVSFNTFCDVSKIRQLD